MCRCLKHIKKTCLTCGNTFGVCLNREGTAKYCSYKCGYEGTGNLRQEKSCITKSCLFCKKEFGVKKYRQKTAKYCSNKCKAQHLKSFFVGKFHPNWKGLTPLRRLLRTKTDYKEWRKSVFERDNYKCVFCGSRGVLNADHIISFAKLIEENNMEKLWNINNGRTLCVPCHKNTDTYGHRKVLS